MLPLEGVRVLDLSRLLPGPYCSLILADLGADVVKIEPPEEGDYLRSIPPVIGDSGAYFRALNRNKRSLTLDLKTEDGPKVFLELVRRGFDVVIESFRPEVMERLGLGYQALRRASESVILCSITGHGQKGPRAERAGHDLNYIGLAGLLGLTGPRAEAPVLPGAQVADVGGGSLMGLGGILAALYRRAVNGEGAWIDISMTEGALAFLSMELGAREAAGRPPSRGRGILLGEFPCYSVYRTRDGRYMTVAAIEPKFWQELCAVLSREDLKAAGLVRGEQGRRVKDELSSIFLQRTRDDWVAVFSKSDVCCEPVLEGDELFDEEQHVARGSFIEVSEPDVGPMRQVACPIRFVDGDQPPRRAAPRLGESTEEVLVEAGFGDEEIERMRKQRVIR